MKRSTISLSDDLHRALEETAAQEGRSVSSIIEESLHLRGIKTLSSARDLVRRAREQASLDQDEGLDVAIEETRAERGP